MKSSLNNPLHKNVFLTSQFNQNAQKMDVQMLQFELPSNRNFMQKLFQLFHPIEISSIFSFVLNFLSLKKQFIPWSSMALISSEHGFGRTNGIEFMKLAHFRIKDCWTFLNAFLNFESGLVLILGYVEPIRRFFM